MKASAVRRVRWLAGIVSIAGLLWLVGCRSYMQQSALPPWERIPAPQLVPATPLPPTVVAGDPLSGPPPPAGAKATAQAQPAEALPPPRPTANSEPSPLRAPGEDPYVGELLDILRETKSVDTFLVTLGLLADAKPDYRQVVPVVVRNAERLGIYARHTLKDKQGSEVEVFQVVSTVIDKLVHGEAGAGVPKLVPPRDPIAPGGPVVPDKAEDRSQPEQQSAIPILPPIPEGQRPLCDDPPDHAAVLRAMSRVERGVPGVCEIWREDFEFALEKLVDKIDPPSCFPLVGPAQLHHCHWKCTVQYNELVAFGYPFVFSCKRPQVEVIYIDRDRLHLWSAAKTKKPTAEETPRVPMKRLRDEAEDLRQLQAEWERFWQTDRALQTRDGE